MEIRCVAIDDEPLALELVTSYIEKTPFLTLVGKYSSALQAMEALDEEETDLLFLDINMPDLTGIEFSKTLKGGPKVIFTTAYEEYALEGFKVNAIDYLLKPFSYEEFLTAVNKAKQYFSLVEKAESTQDDFSVKSDYLFVKSEYKIRKIYLNDILYIEGLKDYVKIYTSNEMIMCLASLKSLEQKLPSTSFMRVHRSYILHLDKIETIERGRVVFGDVYIPVSDQYKEKFQEFLGDSLL
ncbi:LytTR family DNA-binding domain-containing protein [Limibacter armeniacum]|uniref:LytR/AlgR family response regulator transcription factor n=1 Tax=Limibacter armeniacum TaxID=466084 RepID=UPI002FE534A5